jgi:predicted NBD/HSP70 family sugar kinase
LAKEINRKRVYRELKRQVRTSRAEVAERLDLHKNTVNSIVDELIQAGFVREQGLMASNGAGRKAIAIEFRPDRKWAVGVQLTSTVMHWAITDLDSTPLETFSIPLANPTPASAVDTIVRTMSGLAAQRAPEDCIGLCLGIPGLLDATRSRLLQSSHLHWQDVPLLPLLQDRLNVPVLADHSVKLASLGEMEHGAGKQVDNFIYCYFGNGIGCSLIVNGSVVRGDSQAAGELGHLVLDPEGPVCACGNRGCLEAFAGIPALLRTTSAAIPGGPEVPTLEWLLQQLSEHNAAAEREFGQAARRIGQALSYAANLLNPRLIVCDGPLTQASSYLFPIIRDELRQKCAAAAAKQATLVRSGLYPWASCIGAAASVVQAWEEKAVRYDE